LDLPLTRLVEAGIVNRDGCLRRKPHYDSLRALGKNMWLGMPEEEPAEHFSRT
jgi:hypothetical protein